MGRTAGRSTVLGEVSWVDQAVQQDRVAEGRGRQQRLSFTPAPEPQGAVTRSPTRLSPEESTRKNAKILRTGPNGGRAPQRGNLLRAGLMSRKRGGGHNGAGPVLANVPRCLRVKLPRDPCWA